MRGRALFLGSATLLAGCGGPLYGSTDGATVVRYSLRSRLAHRSLDQVLIVPRGGGRGRPVLVLLHGRGNGPDQFLGDPLFRELRALGSRAPVVLLPSGGRQP